MDCFKLNEATYNKIENFLEGQKAEKAIPEETYFKSYYSPATLMNDWYEKRSGETQEKTSEPLLSENMDSFRKPCKSTFPDRREYFNKIFESYGLGQELFLDHLGFSYYDNYVTSYDLSYNHLTKGICGPIPRHYHKGTYTPSRDLTQIYGNLTQWGLKERVYEKMKQVNCKQPSFVSEFTINYTPHDLNAVKKLNDFKTFKKIKILLKQTNSEVYMPHILL